MEKAIIYGAGGTGKAVYEKIKSTLEVVAFLDGDESKKGECIIGGIKCYEPESIQSIEHDYVYLASPCGYLEMRERCIQLGEDVEKIKGDFVQDGAMARINFLEHFADIIKERQNGNWSVAEAGVYRGEFSKEINRVFSEKKIYLFDTFEGFDERDFAYEEQESFVKAGHFSNTNVELVLSKLPHSENAIVRKGYFPETAVGVDDEFGFVSLDMDLYQPILEGLKFFYPRLIEGGVILVDDYFAPGYPNVKNAVKTYEEYIGEKLLFLPIGDNRGVAIIKP